MANLRQTFFSPGNNKTRVKVVGLVVLAALFFIGLIWGVSAVLRQEDNTTDKRCDKERGGCANINDPDQQGGITQTPDQTIPLTIPVDTVIGKIPEGFPKDIPLYETVSIIESNSHKDTQTNEITESKVVFQSKKNFNDSKTYYEKWAMDNAWQAKKVTYQINNANIASFSYSKENSKFLAVTVEKILYDMSKVTLEYKAVSTQRAQQNLEKAFENVKLDTLPIKK